jgi:hypothetical protein
MGWALPWYSVQGKSLETLLAGRRPRTMYLMCDLRQGSKVSRRTGTGRGVEVMGNHYALMDFDDLRSSGMVGGFAQRLAAFMAR